MANTFLAPTTIAAAGLGLLTRDIVLPATVHTTAQANFAGAVGDTINIRKPATATNRVYTDTLRTAGTPITVDDLTETAVPLVLDTHNYSAVAVTDEQLTLKIQDFGQQVLYPQTVAVAEGTESVLATVMNSAGVIATNSAIAAAADGSNIFAKILAARKTLNQQKVPMANRFLAVSPEVEAAILADAENRLVRYEASGDSPNVALRAAIIGRLYGFTVVPSVALTAGTAVAYHQDGFAFAAVAPRVPDGVAFGSSQAYAGMAMRWIRDYDAAFLRDRSVVSVLCGAKILDDRRMVRITGVS